MIYFIGAHEAEELRAVKIGYTSKDWGDRLDSLQTGSHLELRLLGTLPGDKRTESDLHTRFSADRIRGEWFSPSPALLLRIALADKPGRIPSKTVARIRSKLAPSREERELADWLNEHVWHAADCGRGHLCDREDHLVYIGCTEDEWNAKCDDWARLINDRMRLEVRLSFGKKAA